MKKYLKIFFFLLAIIETNCISSCKKENRWDCIKRTGNIVTETRTLPPFTKIYVKDNINVIITQGNKQEVKVEAGNNLISLIKTEVTDGELRIENKNRCNWTRSYKNATSNVFVTMPTLQYITHYGTGKITSTDTIYCDVLDILTRSSGNVELTVNANKVFHHLHETADVTIRGKSIMQGVYHVGEGYLYASDLQTNITWSTSIASGNEYLNAKDFLAVTIDWVGDIYYVGNPSTLEVKGTGTGKLYKWNF
jgi:hypothetical protein